jgi:hypothetical protein
VGEKWVSDDCSYLCKGLIVLFFEFDVILACAPASWTRTRFKKSPIGQKLDFANHPYLCKGLTIFKDLCINDD